MEDWSAVESDRRLHEIVYVYSRIKKAFDNREIFEANTNNRELKEQLVRERRQLSEMRAKVEEFARRIKK